MVIKNTLPVMNKSGFEWAFLKKKQVYEQFSTKQTSTCSKSTKKHTRKRCENFFKIDNKDTRLMSFRSSSVFIVNFEHISHLFLFPLMTFSMHLFGGYQQCNL